jgi:hypothetical protein
MLVFISDLMRMIELYRKAILRKFIKDYDKKLLKKRLGKCKMCGKCCEGCWHLNKKTNLCKIYKKRPSILCYKNFPLDERDQKVWEVKKFCGYKFKK